MKRRRRQPMREEVRERLAAWLSAEQAEGVQRLRPGHRIQPVTMTVKLPKLGRVKQPANDTRMDANDAGR